MNEIEKYDKEKQATDLQVLVESLTIKNEDDFKRGISYVQLSNSASKALEASELGEAKRKAHEAYKQVGRVYKSVSEAFELAKTVCLDKMKRYLSDRKTEPQDDRLYYRETWSAEVYDVKALCQAIVNGEVSEECVKPNLTLLNSLARSSKDFLKVAGVKPVMSKALCFKSEKSDE